MPLYEYQCDTCGTRFERIQRFSDPLVAVCPACGGPVRKLLSSPAIQFKGTGFYITDYAKGGSEPSKADPAKTEAKADAPGETKPAKPAEPAAKSDSPKPEASKAAKSAD